MVTIREGILVGESLMIVLLGVFWCSSGQECHAGFCYLRFVRSRCCVPRDYEYGIASPKATSTMSSEMAIPTNFKSNTALETSTRRVSPREKRFVVNDVSAGPIHLTNVAALLQDNGRFRLSGIAIHSGGDSGQLLGGKVVIHVRAMAAPAASSPIIWSAQGEFWVKRGKPTAIEIPSPNRTVTKRHFSDVSKIQVYLEYYANR